LPETIQLSIVWIVTGSHDARERLIAAAERLLTRSGPRSVSMDAAAAAAGAGKMSAYRHFADRDDLVAAALEHHHPRHLRWLVGPGRADPASPAGQANPAGQILAAFDRLESAAGREAFRGCPFVDAALGASAAGDRVEAVAWEHKREVTRALAGLAAQAGLAEPEELGAAVALVLDGAAAQAALAPDRDSRQRIVRRARRVAKTLLASAVRP
jgi:AcrR family transcriptional regulator